jgi:hypothetical protein
MLFGMFKETMNGLKATATCHFLTTIELSVKVTPWEVYFPQLGQSELLHVILKSVTDPDVFSPFDTTDNRRTALWQHNL